VRAPIDFGLEGIAQLVEDHIDTVGGDIVVRCGRLNLGLSMNGIVLCAC
jgi:hypothetical protein